MCERARVSSESECVRVCENESVRVCENVQREQNTRRGGSRAGGRTDPRPSTCRVVPAAPGLRWESVEGGRVYRGKGEGADTQAATGKGTT